MTKIMIVSTIICCLYLALWAGGNYIKSVNSYQTLTHKNGHVIFMFVCTCSSMLVSILVILCIY